MGKVIFYTRLFVLFWLLFSCGTNNFTKRKYMKGVYVAKHTGATSSQKIVKTNPFVETKNEHIVKAHLKDSKFSEEKAEVIKNEVIIDQNVSNS